MDENQIYVCVDDINVDCLSHDPKEVTKYEPCWSEPSFISCTPCHVVDESDGIDLVFRLIGRRLIGRRLDDSIVSHEAIFPNRWTSWFGVHLAQITLSLQVNGPSHILLTPMVFFAIA